MTHIWIYECMDMQLKDSYEISYILVKNNLSITLNEIEIHSIKYHMGGSLLTVRSLILVSYFLYFCAPFLAT